MDQVLVDALSGIAVPAGIFVVGAVISFLNRFTKDRIVAHIKASAEALAALPHGKHEVAREALTKSIESSARQLSWRIKPGLGRAILTVAASVLGLVVVVVASWPVLATGSTATIASYLGGLVAALLGLGVTLPRVAHSLRSATQARQEVETLRDQLGDLDPDLATAYRNAKSGESPDVDQGKAP
jgi:hypothetical protein